VGCAGFDGKVCAMMDWARLKDNRRIEIPDGPMESDFANGDFVGVAVVLPPLDLRVRQRNCRTNAGSVAI
jgi:hypothetical protein